MSHFDRSLERIDLFKLLLFLIAFLVITFGLIFVLIIPNIKEHRMLKADHARVVIHKSRVETLYMEKEAELTQLKTDNAHVIKAFSHPFSQEEFLEYAHRFFNQVQLTLMGQASHQEEFMQYELNVTTSLKTPTNFYLFLDGLNRYNNIVQADFPIHLEALGDDQISSHFTIKVYDMNATVQH